MSEAERVSDPGYWKLPAPKAFEKAFMVNNYDSRATHYKRTIYLGALLLGIYGIAEIFNLLEGMRNAMIVRYLIIIPAIIIAVNIFDNPRYTFIQDWLICLAGILICILIFTTRYQAYQEGQVYYYYGYLITICYINIVIRPRFIPAIIASTLVWCGSIYFFYKLNMESGRLLYVIFDSSFFLFLSLLSNYSIQLQVRKTYARTLLQERAKRKEQDIQKELIKISNMDSLSKLSNRRFFDEAKEHYDEVGTGVLFIDIDNFKQYNDFYGHLKGDDCIRKVASTINENVRINDLCARYGGEEFVILMKNTTPETVKVIGQRIIEQVRSLAIPHEATPFANVTVSIGWSFLNSGEELQSCIKTADEALYQAKRSGKNKLIPA